MVDETERESERARARERKQRTDRGPGHCPVEKCDGESIDAVPADASSLFPLSPRLLFRALGLL